MATVAPDAPPTSWSEQDLKQHNRAYLKQGKVPGVARQPQAQHALELRHGDVEGRSAGERLDDGLRQVGGQEAQPQHEHAELHHNMG